MKKTLLICSCIFAMCSYSQSRVNLTLHHDARLLFIGDNKGNDALTANLFFKAEIPIKKFSNSYLLVYPGAEFAQLVGGSYQRYSAGAAYVFTEVINKVGAGVFVDYGKIIRQGDDYSSYSVSGELTYKLSNRWKLSMIYQLTERADLKALYNSKQKHIGSGFIGLKFRL